MFLRGKNSEKTLNYIVTLLIAGIVFLFLLFFPSVVNENLNNSGKNLRNLGGEDIEQKIIKNEKKVRKIFGNGGVIKEKGVPSFTTNCVYTEKIRRKNELEKNGENFLETIDTFVGEYLKEENLNKARKEFLTILALETWGTYSPCVVNNIGAVGLIQFTETTAKNLYEINKELFKITKNGFTITGNPSQILSQMTRVEQMKIVELYFDDYKRRKNIKEKLTRDEMYFIIFTGKILDEEVVYKEGQDEYENNKALDKGKKDGKITKKEIVEFLNSWGKEVEKIGFS